MHGELKMRKRGRRRMGNYQSLNVLSQKNRSDFMSDDAIGEVANMIATKGGNRSQRRRLEKSLKRVETIREYAQRHVDDLAFKEYQRAVDKNYCHFFACLALTMVEKYKWVEDDECDQISSLLEKVDKTITKYANMGYETEDLIKLVEEKTGLVLVPDTH